MRTDVINQGALTQNLIRFYLLLYYNSSRILSSPVSPLYLTLHCGFYEVHLMTYYFCFLVYDASGDDQTAFPFK